MTDVGCLALLANIGDNNNAPEALGAKILERFHLLSLGSGILNSAGATLKLCDGNEPEIDTGYLVARALVERSINFGYLAFCDPTEFQSWLDYSQQKAYRLLDRHETAGNVEFRLSRNSLPNPVDIPELDTLLKRFTERVSGEVTRWSKLNLNDRLGAIEKTFPKSDRVVSILLQALTLVCSIGSEAQHGTLLGSNLNLRTF